ncbi:hypothetical protein N0V90_003236 [Kalmusia sp. IMI 367209]|nr:hypothetical protein N0V90_003236 [Kalmusia sp. IMI 367209]
MDSVASFPHLSAAEFQTACSHLVQTYDSLQDRSRKGKWSTVETKESYGEKYLRISKDVSSLMSDVAEEQGTHSDEAEIEKKLPRPTSAKEDQASHDEEDEVEEDDDDEALVPSKVNIPLIHYDVLLSPTYAVPTLYFHISDPQHRFPPTINTLYTHIISPAYTDQAIHSGVLGGITITDHPIENRPVFFIHPCRTAEVMEASMSPRKVDPFEYLVMWIGATEAKI